MLGELRPRVTWLVAGAMVLALAGAGVAVAGVTAEPSTVVILTPPPEHAPVRQLAADRPTSTRPTPATSTHVRYELVGPPTARYVTYTGGQPGLDRPLNSVRLPWHTEFDAARGFIPTITAQNDGDGVIHCRIIVNGGLVSEVSSEGPMGVATCTGSVITGGDARSAEPTRGTDTRSAEPTRGVDARSVQPPRGR
jgi:Mycobacterium membrane protein